MIWSLRGTGAASSVFFGFVFVAVILTVQPLSASNAVAASCCAGSSSIPSLITDDEAQKFQFSWVGSTVVADVPGAGLGRPVFRDDLSPQETRQIVAAQFSTLIDQDRWQAGITVPVVYNQLQTQNGSGQSTVLSDVSLVVGWEALPEYEYSPWKPRIFLFTQWVVPTGPSIYESNQTFTTDVGGTGFWQGHLGAAFVKTAIDWDATIHFKLGTYFGNDFGDSKTGGTGVGPATSFSGSIGAGWSFTEMWRLGFFTEYQYLSPQTVETFGTVSDTSPRYLWNTGFTLTAMINELNSINASYTDQTWFGPVANTTLSRSLGLSWTHRWSR